MHSVRCCDYVFGYAYGRCSMKRIASLGFIGYLPASGTCASLVTLYGIYVLHALHISSCSYGLITFIAACIGLYAIKHSLPLFKHHDPKEIVIDEVVGCLITFLGIPFNLCTALIGFFLFRFFDITKIMGIGWLERQGKVLGVMLDDVGAGILSNLILQILLCIWACA